MLSVAKGIDRDFLSCEIFETLDLRLGGNELIARFREVGITIFTGPPRKPALSAEPAEVLKCRSPDNSAGVATPPPEPMYSTARFCSRK